MPAHPLAFQAKAGKKLHKFRKSGNNPLFYKKEQ
jgi:hypothetical protein